MAAPKQLATTPLKLSINKNQRQRFMYYKLSQVIIPTSAQFRLCIASLLVVFVILSAGASAQEKIITSNDITSLELGKPIERELSGQQEHRYLIQIAEGQYTRVVLDQRGVDAVVELLSPEGKLILEFDNETRVQGEEKVEFVTTATGNYQLLVKAKYPRLASGRYQIQLTETRAAAENDRLLDEARRLDANIWQVMAAKQMKEGFEIGKRALALQERALGSDHPDLLYTLFMLGVVNRFLGDYETAEAFYKRGLNLAQKNLEPDHPFIARFLYNLAYNYGQKGEYARAESLYEQALAIREKALGADHPIVANILTEYALLLITMGDYTRPESMLQRALHISERVFDDDHVDVVRALNYLGVFYASRGDYLSAEPLFQRTLASWERTFGPDHGWVALGLENLGGLYLNMGEYDRAEPLIVRAVSIQEKNNGPDHPDTLSDKANLALLYYKRGDYGKAQASYITLLPVIEKVLGPTHPLLGFHLGKFARVSMALGDLLKAESLYSRALPIIEAYSGANGPDLADALMGLSQLSVNRGNFSAAVSYQSRAGAIVEHNLDINLAVGSERQKFAYLVTLPEQMSQAISLHVRFAPNDATARDLAVTAVLQRKGRVQDTLARSFDSLRSRFNPEDQSLLDDLNKVTARLARLVLSGPADAAPDQQKEIRNLEGQREKIEAEISSRSAEFRAQKQSITLAGVRDVIPDDATLIEFAVYRPFDPRAADPSHAYGDPHYVAYILRKHREVQWKDLGEAKAVDQDVELFRQALSDPQRQDVRELARALDQRIMEPLRVLLGDAKQLLISPDGELNLVPFAAMVDEHRHYLIQNFSITYLSSGRDLLRMRVASEAGSKPYVIANPLFGDGPLMVKASLSKAGRGARRRSITSGNDLSEIYFAPLDGTAQEAQSIKTMFPEASVLTGSQATESALKTVVAPRILHIATHGFFLSTAPATLVSQSANPPAKAYSSMQTGSTRAIRASTTVTNPLLRSGLALAGANLRHQNEIDDGILTALEASGLNLWGTKLVVLSACNTGIGEVRNGEGVYGLRRAFLLAGAESLVMSLWPASDYTTRELMTGYYRNLKAGMGRGAALRQVQLDMLRHNPKLHPFYWANFIQNGEWADLNGKR
jgi:CHAT domain-containing protein/Tfp pilus assembly protein PilF